MTDLCLINPNNRTPAPFSAVEPPLWLGLMAGYALAEGRSVAVIDAEAEELNIEQTIQRIKFYEPEDIIIVVMGNNPSVSSTPKMPLAEELLGRLHQTRGWLAGLHPQAVQHPRQLPRTAFTGFPFIPWQLLPMDKYRAHNWHCLSDIDKRSPYGVLYTSLNCPFSCYYCNVHTLYGGSGITYRPLEDIFRELDYFGQQGIRNIKIWDELFCLDAKRVNLIYDYIIAQGYGFNIWAYTRVDTVANFKKMKRAGINWLAYGFESISNNVRLQANKRFMNVQIEKAIQMTRDADINIIANFMFGLPGETIDDMKASLDMAIRENFEYVNFYCALPYPGSQWYNDLKERPADWSRFNQFSPNIYASPDVVKFRDEAFQTYFLRPEYLSMIKGKFGIKAERHIREMCSWKIRVK